jgi:four helix bundle protein
MGKGFEELKVWQKSKDLAVLIYKVTADGKLSKDFGLRDQIRRSAVSIASNIAEGDERETDKESVRFFYIAKGSLAELRTQLMIALETSYLGKDEFAKIEQDCLEIGKMLGGIIKHRRGDRQ